MTIGVLALQGCVDPHIKAFDRLGLKAIKVRSAEELRLIDRIVLPGGESSTMLRLLERTNLFGELRAFCSCNPSWGVCAGAILLAKEVRHPKQTSLGVMDIRATRNFYGSQLESFKAVVEIPTLQIAPEVDFIRAPLLEPLPDSIATPLEVLGRWNEQSVCMRQGHLLASSFHIELGSETALHNLFSTI